jgi:AbrB family looped-hinge helix DNA binding protein
MVVRLSSKGQLVIPRKVREELMLRTGTELDLRVVDRSIVIRPLADEGERHRAVDRLYGMLPGSSLVAALEAEHQEELAEDERDPNRLRP